MEDGYIMISDKIVVNVKITTIILGTDESLLQLNDVDGFSFQRISLNDFKYKDKILLANQKLSNNYYLSQLQSDLRNIENSSFLCLTKEDNFELQGPDLLAKGVITITDKIEELPELEDYQDKQFNLINRIISKLMLLKTADIGIFEVFCEFSYRYLIMNNNIMNTISINDAKTIITKKYSIDSIEVGKINDFLANYNESYDILKKIIDGYTYSYKTLDKSKSFEQLVSVLETMLLPHNQKNKKETLSKRMALLLGKDDTDIKNIYNKVKPFYGFRSESTHESIDANIGDNELDELRELTRLSILKFIDEIEKFLQTNPLTTFDDAKLQIITNLKTMVSNKISAGILPQ